MSGENKYEMNAVQSHFIDKLISRNSIPAVDQQLAVEIYDAINRSNVSGLKKKMQEAIQHTGELLTWRTYTRYKDSSDGISVDRRYFHDYNDITFIRYPVQVGSDNKETNELLSKFELIAKLSVLTEKDFLRHDRGIIGWLLDDQKKFKIDLLQLAAHLPTELIFKHYKYDPAERAAELGYNYDEFKQVLKKSFKATQGIAGTPTFKLYFDSEELSQKFPRWESVLGLAIEGSVKNGLGYDYIDFVREKGIFPDKPYASHLPVLDSRFQGSPIAMQTFAQIVNFQGASHYLPREQQR